MSNDLKQILETLKRDYLANLPGRIQAMEDLWMKSEYTLLKTEFHKLKGTGKTYGLPEISELGRLGEELCVSDVSQQAIPLALEVLQEIHKSRVAGNEYFLGPSVPFKKLASLRRAA